MIFTLKVHSGAVQLGSEILMALDLCTHPDDPLEAQKTKRGADRRLGQALPRGVRQALRPQGGQAAPFWHRAGRRRPGPALECGARLREIGFDGFGFGGWPLRADGTLHEDSLRYAAEAMDPEKPRYAMGVGRPEEIVRCVDMGYTLFDCVIPTREARHQRLYAFREGCDRPGALRAGVFRFRRKFRRGRKLRFRRAFSGFLRKLLPLPLLPG